MARARVTEEWIRARAGERTFSRGRVYFARGKVGNLSVTATGTTARVNGTKPYEVRVALQADGLSTLCTCPMGDDGGLCKHGVATALAWLAQDGPLPLPDAPEKITDARLRDFLAAQDPEWLAAELMKAAAADPVLRTRLEVAAGADPGAVVDVERLRHRLAVPMGVLTAPRYEYSTYADGDPALARFEEVLEELAALTAGGLAPVAIELTEYAIDALVPHVSDSEHLIQTMLAETREVHKTACAAGHPDPVALADRMVDQADALFADALPAYADALGPEGMARYRVRVERAMARQESDEELELDSETLARLRTHLAEHDGGADGLIALLGDREPVLAEIVRIAEALAAEGRDADAIGWIRGHLERFKDPGPHRDWTVWRDLRGLRELAARCHVRAGDRRGAVELLWPVFTDLPMDTTYKAVVEAAGDHWPRWRVRALSLVPELLSRSGGSGHTTLIEILLLEGEAEAAWRAALDHGMSGSALLAAARSRAETHPADAIPVLLDAAETTISGTGKWRYSHAADLLAEAHLLAERSDGLAAFTRELVALRLRHKRKSALQGFLDKAGLP
ncbi:putative Zn finger protein [Actinocorallia herbida]|uniref:Putative Zn finger protein n=1 Tax=Actinocorallia herbida TaxID=58109 RepID=A0A3N1D2J8_9ACTN|nr:SWIM zinc finger family protein [Actinocorallia herbida]ROO87298.1 putative Zn finger protein [Actinocorallia herbida]